MRAAGRYTRRRSSWRSPGSRARSVHACQGLRPRRVARALAMAHPCVLPSADRTASAPGSNFLRGSMAGLHVPLSTLRVAPRDATRMTRGQHGSLHLCCEGLSPFAPCRSPGAPDSNLSHTSPKTSKSGSVFVHMEAKSGPISHPAGFSIAHIGSATTRWPSTTKVADSKRHTRPKGGVAKRPVYSPMATTTGLPSETSDASQSGLPSIGTPRPVPG